MAYVGAEEKMLWLFREVHGTVSKSCYLEVVVDVHDETDRVDVMKDGHICWSKDKTELMFDYLTRHLT